MTDYHDYLFILSPPYVISEQVKKYKQATAGLIGDFEGMHGKPHITMKRLRRQKPFWNDQLFVQLEKELSLIEPFTLQVNGFATFLPTDFTTIYAAIRSTPEMEDWFKRLRKCLDEKKAVPHITIARQIPHDLAKKLWPKFKDRPWNDSFEVTKLTILQRETFGSSKSWQLYKELPFKGDAVLNALVNKKKEKVIPGVNDVDEQQISLF